MTKSNSEKIIRQFHNMMAWTKKKSMSQKTDNKKAVLN